MNIGNNIKALRQAHNITQEQTAEKLGVSSQAVSKWETNANTPDIALLPKIADVFGVSIDALFSDNIADYSEIHSFMEDDDVIRIVQLRGRKVLKVSSALSPNDPPIEIAFPHDCNDKTQYFKVEVFGHIIADSSINGDVICHQNIQSSIINGDVRCKGNLKVNELNSQKIVCNTITDCYKLQANEIECAGNITAVHLNCDRTVPGHE